MIYTYSPNMKMKTSSTGRITRDNSYLVIMKGSQSRPNLSKQRLDQKSKDLGANIGLNIPPTVPIGCPTLSVTENVIGQKVTADKRLSG